MSGDKTARVEQHRYAGLSRAELHKIATEKVLFYQRRQNLGEPFHHLLDAWRWVEKRYSRSTMSKYIRIYETLCPADKIAMDDPRRDQIIAEMRALHRAKTDEAAAEVIAWWREWPNPRHATALEFAQEARTIIGLNGPAGGGPNTGSSGAVPLSPDRAV